MRLRRIHMGNEAYMPISFNELKQTIKKRVTKPEINNSWQTFKVAKITDKLIFHFVFLINTIYDKF